MTRACAVGAARRRVGNLPACFNDPFAWLFFVTIAVSVNCPGSPAGHKPGITCQIEKETDYRAGRPRRVANIESVQHL